MCRRLKQLGYTLVGMSIALTVAGLIVGAVASGLKVYFYEKAIDDVRNNVSEIREAIEEYVKINGYYPCPAPLTIGDHETGYGLPGNCSDASIADGNGDGIDDNSKFLLETTTAAATSYDVVRGAVPFRVLNIPRKITIDPYNNRIEYAVTRSLAVQDSYNSKGGAIDVINEEGRSILPIAAKAHFAILSHGRDKIGAYTDSSGVQTLECSLTSSVKDIDNCSSTADGVYRTMIMSDLGFNEANHYDDYLLTSMSPDVPFWSEALNNSNHIYFDSSVASNISIGYPEGERANYYNDVIYTITNTTQDSPTVVTLAEIHDFEDGDIVYIDDIAGMDDLNDQRYSIKVMGSNLIALYDYEDNTVPIDSTGFNIYANSGTLYNARVEIDLSVKGETKVSDNIYTHYICDAYTEDLNSDPDMNSCIKIDNLGTGATCASGYVSKIDFQPSGAGIDIVLTCGTVAASDIRCPAGEVVSGITMAGGLECSPPPDYDCANKTFQLCTDPDIHDIGVGENGEVQSVTSGIDDSTYTETYECRNGTWELQGVSGQCDVDASDDSPDVITNVCETDYTEYEYESFAIYNNNESGKSGYSGYWDVAKSNKCEDDYVAIAESVTDPLSCDSGEIKVAYDDCPDGYEGYIYREYEWSCGAGPGWVQISDDGISFDVDDDTLDGDNNYCKKIASSSITKCPTGFSNDPAVDGDGDTDLTDDDDCDICTPLTQERVRFTSCGRAFEMRTLNCTSEEWSDWSQVSCKAPEGMWLTALPVEDAIGPMKDKGSANRLGDVCYGAGVHKSCYAPAGAGKVDGRQLYYQYKDCVCQ